MYKIKRGHILAAMLCVFAFIFCMVFGFRNYTYFAFAALAFVGYVYADRKMLRCPKCGGGTNFELLMRAMKTGTYKCKHCGADIQIEK